ncbi:hypothetical protein FB45DRAFT_1067598 [Roridomyces roridus]|uniref:F-box domain-containing protein n=1 Tax=Roridomyces roridus TaxID=1738132 RepID=A0AAD7F872_9AGAR|nr:hypothetical protein FB45DRAFT_1067598 [Roridomyces roridus]
MLTLPSEITSEIFTHFLPPYPQRPPLAGPHFPWSLLQICRQWRDVALTIPTLWSTMKLYVDDSALQQHALQLHVLDLCMERSRHHPLSIALLCPSEVVDIAFVTPFAEAISPHVSRIRDLELRLPHEHLGCLTGSMSLLRRLIVGPREFLPAASHVSEELQQKLFSDAPNLRDVILSSRFDPFCITLPWSQFTSLTASLYCQEAAEILRHSALLEICNISVYDPGDVQPPISTLRALPSLSSFRLLWRDEGSDGDAPSLQQFFSVLAFPALESLVVSHRFLGDDPVAAIVALRRKGYPRQIAIHDSRTNESVFEAAFPDAELCVWSD